MTLLGRKAKSKGVDSGFADRRRTTCAAASVVAVVFAMMVGAPSALAGSLSVTVLGAGEGFVTSDLAGETGNIIDCDSTGTAPHNHCVETYAGFKVITLTATPAGGAQFAGWTQTGAFSSQRCTTPPGAPETCQVTLLGTSVASVTATFNEPVLPPTVCTAPVVDGLLDTQATFHCTVNPNGTDAKWHFEYKPQAVTTWLNAPVPDSDAGAGEAAEAV
jgi:hypothetical protein